MTGNNLSFRGASSTGSFYSIIHRGMMANEGRVDVPPAAREFCRWFETYFEPRNVPKTILDAGAGAAGYLAKFCVEQGCKRVVALDINADAIDALADEANGVEARHRSLLDIPYESENFDFIICSGVIHHTPDPKRAFEEIYRVLKPGGETMVLPYASKGSVAGVIVRAWRLVARMAPLSVVHRLFRRVPIANNFVLDHMYVPVLWLFSRADCLTLIEETGFELTTDFPSELDPFVGRRFERLMVGDGLQRYFLLRKPSGAPRAESRL